MRWMRRRAARVLVGPVVPVAPPQRAVVPALVAVLVVAPVQWQAQLRQVPVRRRAPPALHPSRTRAPAS